jgi:hypothetical protein
MPTGLTLLDVLRQLAFEDPAWRAGLPPARADTDGRREDAMVTRLVQHLADLARDPRVAGRLRETRTEMVARSRNRVESS